MSLISKSARVLANHRELNCDPPLQESPGEKLRRFGCIDIVDTSAKAMRRCCYNVSTGVTRL
jgi:hypothetical protein